MYDSERLILINGIYSANIAPLGIFEVNNFLDLFLRGPLRTSVFKPAYSTANFGGYCLCQPVAP